MHVRSPRVIVLSLCLAVASATTLAAQSMVGFTDPPSPRLAVHPFTDAEVDDLIGTLDRVFAGPLLAGDPLADPELQLWKFMRWVQTGELAPSQEARVVNRLDRLAFEHPQYATLIERQRTAIPALTIGKVAPDISGNDLDGVRFNLSDYRGKVVVLTFSGNWCGICRAQYPVERRLLDTYKDAPFAMLGVNSDRTLDIARQGLAESGLAYRSWWDGYAASNVDGPISTAYNVYGWPTTYVLDPQGVIRFVDVRQDDLIQAVQELVEQAMPAAPTMQASR
jgi:peroxiredoxin